jgi:hypothetical protein
VGAFLNSLLNIYTSGCYAITMFSLNYFKFVLLFFILNILIGSTIIICYYTYAIEFASALSLCTVITDLELLLY